MRRSAGVVIYRRGAPTTEVLLVLPGGPYWRGKDRGAWQIPKGEIDADELPEAAARREVEEELGVRLDAPLQPLGEIRQAGGKRVLAFATEHDLDPAAIRSNTFEMEWPPRSGTRARFLEVAAARWLTLDEAQIGRAHV